MEFLACAPEIQALLTRGYSVRMAFDELVNKERISMSYCQFNRYVRGLNQNFSRPGTPEPLSPPPPARRETPTERGGASKGMVPRLTDSKLPTTDSLDIEKLLSRTEA